MAKDVPDNWNGGGWNADPGVEVVIARHGFISFAERASRAFVLARMFRVIRGVANTRVQFVPYSEELVAALKRVIEPGETIVAGNQTWTPERCKLQGFDE